jgi:hypothetical protein
MKQTGFFGACDHNLHNFADKITKQHLFGVRLKSIKIISILPDLRNCKLMKFQISVIFKPVTKFKYLTFLTRADISLTE